MLFSIADLQFELLESSQALPTEFAATVETFRIPEDADAVMRFRLNVLSDRPLEGSVLFTSNLVTILSGSGPDDRIFRFTKGGKCALSVCLPEKSIALYLFEGAELCDVELSEQVRVLFRMVFEEIAAFAGVCSLHSSAVVCEGSTVCITGPSGAGKSTLSQNWMDYTPQSFVLNGDRPPLRIDGQSVTVFGAPWSGSEKIFINDSAPLKVIVEVRKHCQNKLQRLSKKKAYTLLLKRVSKPLWQPDAVIALMESVYKLTQAVPVYRYYCANERLAGEQLYKALYENLRDIELVPEGEKDLKRSKNFVMRKILDDYIAVPVGANSASAQGAIMLNEVGVFLWNKLEQPVTRDILLDNLLAEFDVDRDTANADLNEFLNTLLNAGVLEEE